MFSDNLFLPFRNLPRDAVIGIIACVSYSVFSMTTTFTNKAMFSFFHFKYPLCLLFYQHVFTLACLTIARYFGLIVVQPLQWKTVTEWYPVNILFISMLSTGSYALKLLSIPMVTIFKNLTTALVTIGDFAFFGETLTQGIVVSVVIMVLGSVVAGLNDLAFDSVGYFWMLSNCVASAAYVLYMRFAIKKTKLSEWNMVYYNNILAIPTLIPFMYLNGELPSFFYDYTFQFTPGFTTMVFVCGLSGFLISLCSFWAVKTTSATTYSIVGTLNKIPLTILGFIFFESPTNLLGGVSIAIGLAGGFVYTFEKQRMLTNMQTLPTRNS